MFINKKYYIYKKEEFNQLLTYESNRSDISGNEFSLVVIPTDKIYKNKLFFKFLSQNKRSIDTIGYLNNNSIGIILPSTPHDKAQSFVNNLKTNHKYNLFFDGPLDILTYQINDFH